MMKICYYVGMSHHEKPNTINTPETAERLADPIVSREVADTAIDAVTSDPTPDELSLEEQAESLVAGLSYEGQAFSSPADLMKTHKNPRAVRAFIESRRSDPTMDAMYHLADEIWLRNSGKKSRNSARSDEYLQTLIDGYQHSAMIENATDETPTSDEDTTPPETDQPSGDVQPAINLTSAAAGPAPDQPSDNTGNQPAPAALNAPAPTTPAPANQQPADSEAQVGVRITPVENAEAELVNLDKLAGWKADILRINEELSTLRREIALSEADTNVKPGDPITARRQSQVKKLEASLENLTKNIEMSHITPELSAEADQMAADIFAKAQKEIAEQATKDATDRQAKIDSFLTLPPSARQQRKQKRSDDLAQLRSDRKLMHDRLESNGMSDQLKKVADLLAKHNRKIGGGRLSALSHMAWKVENKWRNHPIHTEEGLDLDAKEQRRDLDEILFAEDGMLVKMFTANNIAYDNFTPKELYDVLFAADAKNVLRSSRVASMGRVSCLASGLVNVGDALAGSANAGLNLAIILPRAGQPLYNREINRRYAAIAHLDKAAAKAAAKRSQSSSAA